MQPHKEGNPAKARVQSKALRPPWKEEVEPKVLAQLDQGWKWGGGGRGYEKRPQEREGAKSQKALHAKFNKIELDPEVRRNLWRFLSHMEEQAPNGLGLSRRASWRRSDLSQGRCRIWKAGREGEVWLF